mgnify:CR=1 FL=1
MVHELWHISPQFNGDVGSIAQRFYDMGKTFMSLSEGMFGASGQDQPEAAMEMWMSSMQAALQQWINQIQGNMDMVTPDLPGTGGVLRRSAADFRVDEVPLYPASGGGEHVYLRLRKRGISTFGIPSSRAMSTACSGPPPPKANSTKAAISVAMSSTGAPSAQPIPVPAMVPSGPVSRK